MEKFKFKIKLQIIYPEMSPENRPNKVLNGGKNSQGQAG